MTIRFKTSAILAVMSVAAAAALLWQAWVVGVTYDEPYHLVTGYEYWQGHQVVSTCETPPLTHMISGWVPRAWGLSLGENPEGWAGGDWWLIGKNMIARLDKQSARRIIFLGRLPFIALLLLTSWLVWVWARQLFSGEVALWLAAATLLEPNLLAHSSLIKNDVACAFGLLWVAYSCWSFWRRPDRRRVLLLVLSLSVAVLIKFTLLVMIPFGVGVVVVRYGLARNTKAALAAPAALLLAPYLSLIGGYQFQAVRDQGNLREQMGWEAPWDREEPAGLEVARYVPLPPCFIRGLRYVSYFSRTEGFPSYLLGQRIESGGSAYFPLALALKYPIALQLLLAGGLVALAARLWQRRAGAEDFFVWAPGVLVFALAMRSHIHIGFRHVLACLPFFLLGGGFALENLLATRRGRVVAALLLAWLAAASVYIFPHGISYFNEWAGGPNRGWKYLADSNIDWGQDLPSLAEYHRAHPEETINLAYFGEDADSHYLIPNRYRGMPTPFCGTCVHQRVLQPEPGVYALSVNELLGYFFEPDYRDYFRYFLERKPEAKAGYSIFIYRVPPQEGLAGPGGRPPAAQVPLGAPASISFYPTTVAPGGQYTLTCGELARNRIDLKYTFNGGPAEEAREFCLLDAAGSAVIRVPKRLEPGTIRVVAIRTTGTLEWRPADASLIVR